MPEASNTGEIHRPASEVFEFLADGTNDPRWRSGVMYVKLRAGSGQGAVYEQQPMASPTRVNEGTRSHRTNNTPTNNPKTATLPQAVALTA
jgi:hypothetical protein